MEKSRILVIDDERVIRKGCEQVLIKMDFLVDTAENGRLGFELVQQNDYDLILVDLMMPEMDGIQFLKKTREKDPNLVTIVITGHATIESAVTAVKSGAYDYLPKPFTPETLRTIVKRGLDKRQLVKEAEALRQERDRNLLEISNERTRLRTIVNCIGEGLLVTNRKGQLVLINPLASKMLKMKNENLIGQPAIGNLNNKEIEDLIQTTLEEIEPEKNSVITRQVIFNEENAIIYHCTLAPIQENSGEILGLILSIRDISEEKKLEKIKSEFVHLVAHELKAPLGATEGYLSLVLDTYNDLEDEQKRNFIEKSRDKAQALQQLIKDLLDYSAIEAGAVAQQMGPIKIQEVINEVVDFMKLEMEKKSITLNMNIPPDIPVIRGDKNDLGRLFTNLLSNAIKYNKDNGTISIQIETEELFLKVSIHDTGIGLTEEEQSQIFNDFFRVNNAFTRKIPGTGLGLSIAKRLAESHFGYIGVSSEVGKGSTFSVHLPLLGSGIGQK